ncbi:MFS transporter [Patescibacteria group bacterium]|nr:MFS transporter [Patescibacteria group bacterium]
MHWPHYHLHFFKNRELNELYISVAIRSFALSMISVFIPIFLLKLNYSLSTVFIFYAVLFTTHVLFIIPATKISSRFGFKHSIFYSVPILIIFYFGLFTLEQFNWPIYLLAVIYGICNSLFWMGYHVDFSKFSDEKNRGKEVGVTKIVSLIFHTIGPVIGGLILTFIGFQALFATVSVLLITSVIPLFFSKDIHDSIRFSIKEIFKGQTIKNALAFAGHGIELGISSVIWPIFIFFTILNNFTTLGLVSSLSILFSLIFVFIVAKYSDIHRRLILKIGAIMNALIWGVRFFIKTTFQVFIIDSFYGVSQSLISIPFDALSYDKANKSNIVKFIIFRETIVQTGKVILFLVMTLITTLTTGFFFGGGASLLYLLF